jgi:hypothetical protein
MTRPLIERPGDAEFDPYYARYIDRIPEGDLIHTLREQVGETVNAFGALTDSDADYRYAPGKWSAKEMVGHLADTERIMSYRALAFARGEQQPLPGFDENAYVANASFSRLTIKELLEEFRATRESTLRFLCNLTPEELKRSGSANGKGISVRALAYIIAGHERHHLTIFRERYLPGIPAGR